MEILNTVDFTESPRLEDINTNSTTQTLKVPENFDKIATPSRLLITGPTMSGKSRFILQLLQNRHTIFDRDFEQIIYCLPPNCFNLHADFLDEFIMRVAKFHCT